MFLIYISHGMLEFPAGNFRFLEFQAETFLEFPAWNFLFLQFPAWNLKLPAGFFLNFQWGIFKCRGYIGFRLAMDFLNPP